MRGYHFASMHTIQDNIPVDNVIAMYNSAHKYEMLSCRFSISL